MACKASRQLWIFTLASEETVKECQSDLDRAGRLICDLRRLCWVLHKIDLNEHISSCRELCLVSPACD